MHLASTVIRIKWIPLIIVIALLKKEAKAFVQSVLDDENIENCVE